MKLKEYYFPFVADFYQQPVAVNDIGMVSYMNDKYVLDLYGLSSEEVHQLKSAGKFSKSEISNIILKKKIELVMIYDVWFKEKPDNWLKVAVLKTKRLQVHQVRFLSMLLHMGMPH